MNFKTIGIIAKDKAEAVSHNVKQLYDFLQHKHCSIMLDQSAAGLFPHPEDIACDRDRIGQQADLAIVVGGDGTFLSVVRALANYDVPILGVNLGRLGFLVDISPVEMIDRIDKIIDGEYVRESRFLLTAQVIRDGKIISEADAFNDVVVHIRDVARMIEFETYINGCFVNFQRADGLVISTPTGSTAYALSSGGPLMHATLEAMVLVPICPHTLTNRPLVVNSDSCVEIVIGDSTQTTSQVTLDGQIASDVKARDRIVIRRKPKGISLIHPADYDYYEILRAKLKWSEQL